MFIYSTMTICPPDRISKVMNHISKTGAGFLFSKARIIDSNYQEVGRFLTDARNPNF